MASLGEGKKKEGCAQNMEIYWFFFPRTNVYDSEKVIKKIAILIDSTATAENTLFRAKEWLLLYRETFVYLFCIFLHVSISGSPVKPRNSAPVSKENCLFMDEFA